MSLNYSLLFNLFMVESTIIVMRKPTEKQQAIVDQFNELGVARCHSTQANQAFIKQWITDNNIEVVDCSRKSGIYPNGLGNPHKMTKNWSNATPEEVEADRNKVCDEFQKTFNNNPINLSTLNGKLLTCCNSDNRCHLDTYIKELTKTL